MRDRGIENTQSETLSPATPTANYFFFFLKLHLKSIYEKDYMIHLFLISLETSEEL